MVELFECGWEGKYNYHTVNFDFSPTDWAIPIRIQWFKSDPDIDEDSYIPICIKTLQILCVKLMWTKTWDYEEEVRNKSEE